MQPPARIGGADSRFSFANPIAKILFFILREGFVLSARKVAAVALQRRVEKERALVVALGTTEPLSASGNAIIAVGPQASASVYPMRFPAPWSGTVRAGSLDLAEVSDELQAWLSREPWRFRNWFNYSPYAGQEPCLDLSDWLRARWAAEPVEPVTARSVVEPTRPARTNSRRNGGARPELFLLGAGAYPQAYSLPVLSRFRRSCVVDINEYLVDRVRKRFGFEQGLTDWQSIVPFVRDALRPVIVIATYHSTHFEIAQRLLQARPDARIMIEKPPVTSGSQLRELVRLYRPESLAIGYNRRFAPFTTRALECIGKGAQPLTMTVQVKEINLPSDHWYYWPTQGSRITGNLCHWFDLACCFIDSPVRQVSAVSAADNGFDEAAVSVVFDDGSLLNLVASERGNSLRGVQEHIELRRGDVTVVIDDYLRLRVQKGRRQRVLRSRLRDKGHLRMYDAFQQCVLEDRPFPYSKADLLRSSTLYLDVVATLRGARPAEPTVV